MEGLGINLGYLLMQILLFVVLLLVLRAYLYAPITRTLEERKARIAKGLEDARQAAIARDNADADARKILDGARGEAAKIRQDAALEAEERANAIVSQANDEARGVLAAAREDAELERNRILAELRGQVVSIAMAAANKVVGESLDETKQHQLINDFLAAPPAGLKAARGEKVTVTSALPLTNREQDRVAKSIDAENVTYQVDPRILGGLIVRVGDQVVDGSVQAQISSLRDSLQ
jgi:F-type H+-transporting ATPase subunit b